MNSYLIYQNGKPINNQLKNFIEVLDFLDKNPNLYEILYHNYSVVLKKL